MPQVRPPHFTTAGLSLLTHDFKEVTGAYETVRVANGKPFFLDLHIEHFMHSADALNMKLPVSKSELKTQVTRTIEAGSFTEAAMYLFLTGTVDGLELRKGNVVYPLLSITCSVFKPHPVKFYTEGVSVGIRHFQRINPDIKDLSQRNSKKHLREETTLDEVLIENDANEITEATQCNLFIVKNGTLITPATGMLPGVTREVVLSLASKLLPVEERALSKQDVLEADECFLTGTLHNVVPVTKVDGEAVGEGKAGMWTKKIMKQFCFDC